MAANSRTRIVLDEDIRAVVDQIQVVTRVNSPSQAIALMVSRYGRHLLETWELDPALHPDPNPAHYYPDRQQSQPENFKFTEPVAL